MANRKRHNQPAVDAFQIIGAYLTLLLIMVIAVGCQGQIDSSDEDPTADSSKTDAESAMVSEQPTSAPSTLTSSVPAETITPSVVVSKVPEKPVISVEPAKNPTIEATAVPPTATPDQPPAPHVNVETEGKRASDCSPDYPCNDDISGWESRMRVPQGFRVSYFARVDGKPTAMTVGPEGNLFVAVITGTIYTVDQSGSVDNHFEGLRVPTGLAFEPVRDRLYVSSRVVDDYVSGEGQVAFISNGSLTQVLSGLPCCYIGMHGPNGITFGPDGYGYVGVGGRADHGEILVPPNNGQQDELHPLEASIIRFSPDGDEVSVLARGFRNPYDHTWDAEGRMYATDNGRDGSQDEATIPPDELHEVFPGGEHGYPYFECPDCFGIPDEVEVIKPLHELVPHGAAAGITTYLDDEYPGYYNDLFLVLWSAFEGAQKVQRIGRDRSEISDFATGFAAPIDIVVGSDGGLYVADFATGIIFQISYVGDDNSP